MNIDKEIMIFLGLQLLSVIISTIKSIVTIEGGKGLAALVNSVSYAFNAIIIKLITKQPFSIVITVTFITNLIGVYVGKWLIDKLKKDRLWTITATVKDKYVDELEESIRELQIPYTIIRAENNRNLILLFSNTKPETSKVKGVLNGRAVYSAIENKTIG